MNSRALEATFIVAIMLAVLFGGPAFVANLAQFHGVAISVLGILAIAVIYAFRQSYLAAGPGVRLQAARDAAFLAAMAAAIAFVVAPARWSLGATVAALEFALLVQLLSRYVAAQEDRLSR